ncbi:PilZ domain-containing protein [Parahaliea aestuarii]|uniref:PilZ domain-containing protein n=1 Tax=Parahaliea aestuarii TaxID=1852021 RepID=A0A5C8ZPV6_9GAMM|nr:PilZ domain-containing protein [Parahaliea aestuarii]TXS89680.1 PilZ domain-containing protein [Parahaliea aestuarii]
MSDLDISTPATERRHLRLPVAATVFIEIDAATSTDAEPAVEVCTARDVSRGGLQVTLSRALQVDQLVQVAVRLDHQDTEAPLFLVGQVVWCQPDEAVPATFAAGMRFLDVAGTEYQRWNDLLIEEENRGAD